MKESYWGYWIILLGIFVIAVMFLVNDATTTDTQDYYALKEVASAALNDSVDYAYFAQTGQIRIIKEVFVENFLRRFSQSVSLTDTYQIDFYDLYESPPKVSVKITTKTSNFVIGQDNTNLDVSNSIDLILELDSGVDTSCTNPPCSKSQSITKKACSYYDKD
jgi:hypothetical protein